MHHVYFEPAYHNGGFDPYGYMVFIIAYPNIHALPAFEQTAFQQQGLQPYGVESAVFGFPLFFPGVSQVEAVYFIVEAAVERNGIALNTTFLRLQCMT